MVNINRCFTVSGLFRWYSKDTGETLNFEERFILVLATNFDNAIDKAELEALEYCEDDLDANFSIEDLSKYYAYEVSDEKLVSEVEVFGQP